MRTILVAGATGMIGRAIAERFATTQGWRVLALSRRACPLGFPVERVTVDLLDNACAHQLTELRNVSHLVYAALGTGGDPRKNWGDADLDDRNVKMYSNLISNIVVNNQIEHVTLIEGGKAYGLQYGRINNPAREDDPRHMPPNFYFNQEDLTISASAQFGFGWTVFRPMVIAGNSINSAMNIIGCIAAYGTICKELGIPFRYTGGATDVPMQMTDSRLLSSAVLWSMTAAAARNEIFNVTNGDVIEWRSAWRRIVAFFDCEYAMPQPMPLAVMMRGKDEIWDAIRERYKLSGPALSALAGQSWGFADGIFNYACDLPLSLLSTIKLRAAGFNDCIDSLDSVIWWLSRLRTDGVIP